ncbi:MAG: lipid-binding SYLF domain-containing protein [Verrucomicrobiota bacterium]
MHRSPQSPHFVAAMIFGFLVLASSVYAINEKTLDRRSLKLFETLNDIQTEANSRIPASVLKQAKGVIIMKQYEAGLVFGGKGGYGLAMTRGKDGKWGPPAWIKTGEGSWGLQVGVQKLNVVVLLMNDNVLNLLYNPKFRLGVDAGATAGPVGRNIEAKIGNDTPILIYTNTTGLYAGAALEAGFLIPAKKANALTYGDEYSIPQIISGRVVPMPEFGPPIVDKLQSIERE